MVTEFNIWQTIVLGTRVGGPHYCELIDGMTGLHSANYAWTLLKSRGFTISANPYEIDLVHVSVTDLGLKESTATYEEVCMRAVEHGLMLCPADAGPELYLKVHPMLRSTGVFRVIMGMMPIEDDKDGEMHVFDMGTSPTHSRPAYFGRGCDLRTKIENGRPVRLVWSNYYHFVFVLPRKKEFQKQKDRMPERRDYVGGLNTHMLNPAIIPGCR